ncbi:MAG: hypothetical protein J0I57_07855 [Hyphomicrobium sp.]|uniref:hypothetical protein n=1 Tax=Hyphomicrobium sp. CS1BSMeth3 TaxID=1892844 RepID=UPI000868E03F|nr:hypothetical protein [Hyphomicrobium sp. CS1BSMeth3]MBN9262132.1 hypothetical protein [Hyphomicrobium sp.]MBN9277535.1 hypothetical protein [Hyphomicrobium sp.]ODT21235.1 MAG: hypothetical protein ABS54_13040 [Hyphomicrobium sp. SCN 65-11]OJU24204.1 MAG: hypothetical protein BGN89_20500 [Alphaproteobacteria bacterium 64-6]
MIVRAGVAMALVLALAGCRSDFAAMKLGGPGYGSVAQAHERQDRYGIDRLPEKTMSDRMLAAMALERVTGLKPDPSRFLDSP